jgi:membrane protease YdiL (CAAX protease family)
VAPQRALAILVSGLAAAVIARSAVISSDWHFVYNVSLAVAAVLLARSAGLGPADLGCAPERIGAGLRLGGLALLAITAVLVVAAFAGLLEDDRTAVGAGEMLVRVLVVIPIGTVAVEELSFRGALDGLLGRVTTPTRTYVVGALLFGMWHVPPIAGDGVWPVLGTVVATTAAGAGFIWLRRRSDSLVAPILAHVGTNSVTFALSWLVGR